MLTHTEREIGGVVCCGKGYVVVEDVSSEKIRYMKVRVRKQTDNKNCIRLKTEQKGDQQRDIENERERYRE